MFCLCQFHIITNDVEQYLLVISKIYADFTDFNVFQWLQVWLQMITNYFEIITSINHGYTYVYLSRIKIYWIIHVYSYGFIGKWFSSKSNIKTLSITAGFMLLNPAIPEFITANDRYIFNIFAVF